MATVTFVDTANDGTLSADTQYSTTPGAGDTIIVAAGTKDLTGDAQSLTNIPGIWQFRFGTGGCLARKIGTATTAVTIEASIQAEIQGNGYLQYVNLSAGTSTSKVAVLKISNVPSAQLTAGAFDVIEAYNVGSLYIGAGVNFLTLRVAPGTNVFVEQESSGSKPSLVEVAKGASVRTKRSFANAAYCTNEGSIQFEGAAGTGNSSSVVWNSGIITGQSTGTLYGLNNKTGGEINANGATQNQTWTVKSWAGSKLQRSATGIAITITETTVP